jgi:F0F1-type ATP synthase membrane subunit a
MNYNFFLTSPLEQFQVLPIIGFYFNGFDISITNETIILGLILFFSLVYFNSILKQENSSFYIVPSRWQAVIEIIYSLILSLVIDNIRDKKGQYFFPLVFFIFLFILSLNLIGLIPYSFTLTSHLIVTLSLSLAVFIGINIVCIRIHGINFFSLFLPSGTSIVLAFLLVPIELISYIFKPISLSIRLFANMMAGHTLLKVIAGFAYTLMSNTGILFMLHYVPLLILIPLFGLELGVALIQSFVFSILICIYLNDSINLH